MPEAQESVSAREPRHRRHASVQPADEVDPFDEPDPVEQQLRRWRAERAAGAVASEQVHFGSNGTTSANGNPPTRQGGEPAHRPVNGSTAPGPGLVHGVAQNSQPPRTDPHVRSPTAPSASAPTAPPLNGYGPPRDVRAPQSRVDPTLHETPTATFGGRPFVQPVRDSDGRGIIPASRSSIPRSPGTATADQGDGRAAVGGKAVDGISQADETSYAIVASGLHKRFKDTIAVDDVSFSVPQGQIVAILGPNGAGKTTTVNMLCTLLTPDKGTATVYGHDVVNEASAVRRSIMLTGQFAALDEALTGRENLILFGRLLGLSKSVARARADELLDMFSLTDAGAKRVGQYSGGMRRRIDIACGLVTQPKVVFLDEPTTGLDPRSRQEVWTLVERLRDSGVTILLTTQYLEEADVLSDNIVVIDKGRVIAEGTSDELKLSIGAAYCEVTPAHARDLDMLRRLFADLIPDGGGGGDDHVVAVPAPRGPETLVEVIRRTTEAGIELTDVAMRRPSLDEVFLALTDPRRDRPGTAS